jgi:hypothetical protein
MDQPLISVDAALHALASANTPDELITIADQARRHCRCIAERLSEQAANFHHPGTNQFFTKRPLARRLYEITKVKIAEHQIAFDCWLEPAAGEGAFFDLLPAANRLGIEIETRNV